MCRTHRILEEIECPSATTHQGCDAQTSNWSEDVRSFRAQRSSSRTLAGISANRLMCVPGAGVRNCGLRRLVCAGCGCRICSVVDRVRASAFLVVAWSAVPMR